MSYYNDDETVLVLDNGNSIVTHGADGFVAGGDIHVLAPDGTELGCWDSAEWQEDPVLVMGAILRMAAGFKPEKTNMGKRKS